MATHLHDLPTLEGFFAAVPTPFAGGVIDEEAFTAFCAWQLEEGTAGLVVCGTTGEAPTLSSEEQQRLIELAVGVAGGGVPVIAGVGSNATAHTQELARAAEAAGADGLLVVVPYYNRPSQAGLVGHFTAVHNSVGIPLILYDVPSRTGCALADATVKTLAQLPRVVGIKDATGDIVRARRLRRMMGPAFRLLSGDDATVLDFMDAGGDGCISVVANVAPALCAGMMHDWRAGKTTQARASYRRLEPLIRALFLESNPIPLKLALSLEGWMRNELRLPLCEAGPATRLEIKAALSSLWGPRAEFLDTEPAIVGAYI